LCYHGPATEEEEEEEEEKEEEDDDDDGYTGQFEGYKAAAGSSKKTFPVCSYVIWNH
jgi:hypothetical protein